MNFRATSFAIGSRAIRFSSIHSANLLRFQEQISSGVRMQRPSDDPIAYRQVTSLTSRLTELQADTQSLNGAKAVLGMSVVQVQEYSNLMTAARSLALQGVQATDDNERNALKLEVDGILNQMKNIAISQFDGAFIFGGTQSESAPFSFDAPAHPGGTLSVDYFGSSKNSRAFIGEAVSVDTYYAGNSLFSKPNRSDTVFIGQTGAKAGSGTDTLIGRANLTISHLRTELGGKGGILNGADADQKNTILGSGHTLTINDTSGNGSEGTISLDGGPPVKFTGTDDNLLVENNNGEKVYLNTTEILPGFSGTFDISATGQMSVDGGQSFTEIDYSENQIVTDSTSGRFVTVDTRDVNRVGDESLEFPGTADAFQVLYELSEDLANTRNLSTAELAESLNRRVADLEKLSDHALHSLGEQSTSLQSIERLEFRIQDLELAVESQLSDIQATDIPEAVLRMENSQSLLEYTYAVTAQLNSIDLLNFLR